MTAPPNTKNLDVTAAESMALRATRAITVLTNLVSAPFYVNSQIPYGISLPEWRTLREIYAQPGITKTEIAEQTAQHIMTLSRSVRQLTAKGLVEGRVDPDDRRRTQLFTTSIGNDMAAEMRHREAVQVRHIVDGITDREADQLVRIVDKLIDHVRRTERPVPPPVSRDWRAIVDSESERGRSASSAGTRRADRRPEPTGDPRRSRPAPGHPVRPDRHNEYPITTQPETAPGRG